MQGGEGWSRVPGCETPTKGLRPVRSHPNPSPKALSVHDTTARAPGGPTRFSEVVESQQASARKWFVACLLARHGWRGASMQRASVALAQDAQKPGSPQSPGASCLAVAIGAGLVFHHQRAALASLSAEPLVAPSAVSITTIDKAAHPRVRRGPTQHQQ